MIGGRVSRGMRRLLPSWACCRVAIGVVALYALMLQPFMAAAAPFMVPDPFGVVCAPDHNPEAPVGDPAAHAAHHCCIVAHIGGLAPPPERRAMPGEMPRVVATIVWRAEAWIPRTGPPTHAASARGPPLV